MYNFMDDFDERSKLPRNTNYKIAGAVEERRGLFPTDGRAKMIGPDEWLIMMLTVGLLVRKEFRSVRVAVDYAIAMVESNGAQIEEGNLALEFKLRTGLKEHLLTRPDLVPSVVAQLYDKLEDMVRLLRWEPPTADPMPVKEPPEKPAGGGAAESMIVESSDTTEIGEASPDAGETIPPLHDAFLICVENSVEVPASPVDAGGLSPEPMVIPEEVVKADDGDTSVAVFHDVPQVTDQVEQIAGESSESGATELERGEDTPPEPASWASAGAETIPRDVALRYDSLEAKLRYSAFEELSEDEQQFICLYAIKDAIVWTGIHHFTVNHAVDDIDMAMTYLGMALPELKSAALKVAGAWRIMNEQSDGLEEWKAEQAEQLSVLIEDFEARLRLRILDLDGAIHEIAVKGM